jgi:hypothetical protein
MPMADLRAVLIQIRDGIARNAYPNETAVRTQIVQRILHELGWNVFDPDQVYNEYPLKLGRTSRRIDLALCVKDRKPRCIVELKSTDYDLKEIGRSDGDRQLFEYAFHAGAPLALLTNGVNWRLYSTHSAGTYAERLVRTLDIEAEPLDEVAAALDRYLSFPNTASGRAADYARVDLDKRIDRHKAKEAIPRAWTRLVEDGPDGRLAALLLDATSSLVDSAPAKQDVADYLRHLKSDDRPSSRARKRTRTSPPKTLAPMVKENRGDDKKTAAHSEGVRYHLLGKERVAKNARDAYVTVFKTLAERDGGFLNRVDPKLRGRKNRGLARTNRELSDSDSMVRSAALLPGDWWLLTHLSNKQKTHSLRIACEVAGIPFGERAGLELILPNA